MPQVDEGEWLDNGKFVLFVPSFHIMGIYFSSDYFNLHINLLKFMILMTLYDIGIQ